MKTDLLKDIFLNMLCEIYFTTQNVLVSAL